MLSCTACRARLACDLLGESSPPLCQCSCLCPAYILAGSGEEWMIKGFFVFVCLFVVERGKEQERQRKEKEEA